MRPPGCLWSCGWIFHGSPTLLHVPTGRGFDADKGTWAVEESQSQAWPPDVSGTTPGTGYPQGIEGGASEGCALDAQQSPYHPHLRNLGQSLSNPYAYDGAITTGGTVNALGGPPPGAAFRYRMAAPLLKADRVGCSEEPTQRHS